MSQDAQSRESTKKAPPRRKLPFWKKALVAASLLVMLIGAALQGYAHIRADNAPVAEDRTASSTHTNSNSAFPARGFLPNAPSSQSPDQPATSSTRSPDGLEAYAPAVFRLGFSFFVGFCIAYALRTFFKISIAAIGFILLILFGLQYAGILQVDWHAMERHYDSAAHWIGNQLGSFKQFITGQLPSAAMALSGLVVGFKR